MNIKMRAVLAQLDLLVGDVTGNTDRILAAASRARDELDADLVVVPELALTGYPPEDLLYHSGLRAQVEAAVERLRTEVRGIALAVGYPQYADGGIFNVLALIEDGKLRAAYRKRLLPNYSVFDEKRYFQPGSGPTVVDIKGIPVGLTICEDAWEPGPVAQTAQAGAAVVLNVSASPYDMGKQDRRERQIFPARVGESGVPFIVCNLVGGQDELVFDGNSMALDASGRLRVRAPAFEESLTPVDMTYAPETGTVDILDGPIEPEGSLEATVYQALVRGVRDYVGKNGFPGVVIGLSGGIDSALTLAIAVDALGAECVSAVMMPSRYTSELSLSEAAHQAQMLGIDYRQIPIEQPYEAFLDVLAQSFAGCEPDTTEENIQARCRGIILMALSNKTGKLVLTTGNKSEMAVGYATLYGDMAGGFAPIRDVSKTWVYRLARYRNSISPAIPEAVIVRAPSAELAAGQKDSDSLPPYDVLDRILEAYIEDDRSAEDIIASGEDADTVNRVIAMVKRNEYKRRQAPPGVRISRRAFGRDRRYPITSGYVHRLPAT